LVLVLFGGDPGLTNDVTKLVALIEQFTHPMLRKHLRLDNKSNPRARLPHFLQTNAKFMNKICTTFRGTTFFVIRSWRVSTANQLSRNMPTHSCVGQRINNFAYTRCEINQSFEKLI